MPVIAKSKQAWALLLNQASPQLAIQGELTSSVLLELLELLSELDLILSTCEKTLIILNDNNKISATFFIN